MSTSTVIMEADAGELITDMFKSVYHVMSHPDVNKVILVHNGTEYTITKVEVNGAAIQQYQMTTKLQKKR